MQETKVDSILSNFSFFQHKYIKKYMFFIPVLGIGLFVGGVILPGIFAGVFSGVAFQLSVDRLKDSAPRVYNWMLDHPGLMELGTTLAFTGVFGLTATGIVASLISNILTSIVLDYYAEKEGRVPVEGNFSVVAAIKSLFTTVKEFIFGKSTSVVTTTESKDVVPHSEVVVAEFANVQ